MLKITSLSNNRLSVIRIVLALMLILDTSLIPVQAQVGTIGKIKIAVVSGEQGVNRISKASGPPPGVQVQDANGQPISGAIVLFVAPDGGPGVVFSNGSNTFRVVTDEKGMAVATGFRPNDVPGEFQIRAEASYQGQTATAAINQTNAKKSGKTKLYLILALAAGAGAGVGLATKGKGGSSSTSPPEQTTTISTGTYTVGAPP
jgi:hypothetical protein